ncbi:MAG: thioredoxin family protein [Calditrichaeota bacterium]|nr:thioredoxin family protein [Calditrichota bacterium]
MKKSLRIAIVLVVVIAVAGIIFLKRGSDSQPIGGPLPGSSGLPELVDLGGKFCKSCKAMAPILDEVSKEYAGRAKVTVIDVREDKEAGRRYGVRVIPTQIFFDANGKEVYRHEGFLGKDEIKAQFTSLGVK